LYEDQETSSQNFSTPISGINNGFGIFTGMSSDELLLEIKPEVLKKVYQPFTPLHSDTL